jgi:hypothetical protein
VSGDEAMFHRQTNEGSRTHRLVRGRLDIDQSERRDAQVALR